MATDLFVKTLKDAATNRALDIIKHENLRDFITWAEEEVYLPDGTRFRFRPAQRIIAESLFDPSLQSVNIRAFSGFGKTFLIAVAFGYVIEQLRREAAVMLPAQTVADDLVSNGVMPILDTTPIVAGLLKRVDLKRSKIWWNGGALFSVGANSAAQIRRLEASFLYADEIDSIKSDKADEGDKLQAFWKRGRGRKEVFKIATSYPSLKGFSKIDSLFDQSDGCRWFVNCCHCDFQYEMHHEQMRWTPGNPEGAKLICPSCGEEITDSQRKTMAERGMFLDKNGNLPQPGVHRGYHIGCMSHTGDNSSAFNGYLHEVAAEIEAIAKADDPSKAKRVFINTMASESFSEEFDEKPELDELYRRREDYDPNKELPDGVLMLTMGVDVQKNRMEYFVLGSGLNGEFWGIDYGVIHGSVKKTSTFNQLDRARIKKWKQASGNIISPACVFIDSGYEQGLVLDYTRQRMGARVYGVKGSRTLERPLVNHKPSKVGRPPAPQVQIGTHAAKAEIYQALQLKPPAEGEAFPHGYWHFPKTEAFGETAGGDSTGFFEMLTAEDSRLKKAPGGEWLPFFENQNRSRNEAIDCAVYALAATRFMRPNYEKIRFNQLKNIGAV